MMTACLLVTVFKFIVSYYVADSLDCERESGVLATHGKVRLYAAECGSGKAPRLVRERSSLGAGIDTFLVWDSGCASYFAAVTDAAGHESCWLSKTVGIPPVSVPPIGGATRDVYFDLQGRRINHKPEASGIYYSARQRRWLVILR